MRLRDFASATLPTIVALVVAVPATDAAAQEPAAPPTTESAASMPRRRPALLREGTLLALARGRIEAIEGGGWRFVPEVRDANGLERELILLPGPALEDVVRLAGRAESANATFEVSGEVVTYGGRNWLLMSFVSPIGAPKPSPEPAGPAGAPDEEGIADELERRLLERVGNVPASLAPTDDELAAAVGRPAPLAHGSLLQSRRGRLVRDTSTGGIRFVFTHQREAVEPASLVVLPCLLLERVEATLRRTDDDPALVVTGTVISFAGRNYLRPTAIRPASEGKGLDP